MKTKELIIEKPSVMEQLREIRDKISADLYGKSTEEIQSYIKKRNFIFQEKFNKTNTQHPIIKQPSI